MAETDKYYTKDGTYIHEADIMLSYYSGADRDGQKLNFELNYICGKCSKKLDSEKRTPFCPYCGSPVKYPGALIGWGEFFEFENRFLFSKNSGRLIIYEERNEHVKEV